MMSYLAPSVRASGQSFATLKAVGLRDYLDALIAVNAAATAAPTAAPTTTATGGGATGGLLAAGAYLLTFTETNGAGETTAAPESVTLTVSATNIPRVTFPALKTGNIARNLYATAAGGLSGTEVLYASGIATTTYDMAVAAPASTVAPPSVNSTGLTAFQSDVARNLLTSSLAGQKMQIFTGNYLGGAPLLSTEAPQWALDYAAAFALLAQLCNELGTLFATNLGSLHTALNGASNAYTYRTFP